MNNTITLLDEDKKERTFRLLVSFVSEDEKEYIVYTDDIVDEDDFKRAYAGIIQKNKILPLDTDLEFENVEKILKKLVGDDSK